MNNSKTLAVFAFIFLFAISFASASVSAKSTVIAGKVYDATNNYAEVNNANVSVECNDNTLNAVSIADGSYFVTYDYSSCPLNSNFSVSANFEGLSGESQNNKVSLDLPSVNLSIGVGNVALVPEFGVVIGSLTLVSAIVVFFVIRRK
jgi:hypothetical protein